MKLAEELKRESRRSLLTLYYNSLIKDLWSEAHQGGGYKTLQIAKNVYNEIAKKLLKDGFEVTITNFDIDNPLFLVYIIWDKDKFDDNLKDNTEIDRTKLHSGLI